MPRFNRFIVIIIRERERDRKRERGKKEHKELRFFHKLVEELFDMKKSSLEIIIQFYSQSCSILFKSFNIMHLGKFVFMQKFFDKCYLYITRKLISLKKRHFSFFCFNIFLFIRSLLVLKVQVISNSTCAR